MKKFLLFYFLIGSLLFASHIEENNITVYRDDFNPNSVNCLLSRSSSFVMEKEITLTANNTNTRVDLFKIHGIVEIVSGIIEITDATVLNNCTNLKIAIYDGTQTIDLCTDGANISGLDVGAVVLKNKTLANDLTVLSNSDCIIMENEDKKQHQPFIVLQKKDTDTFLSFFYATTDTPINAKLNFIVQYKCIDGGYIEEVL